MLGKTNAVSGKQKYGAYNIEQVEVDGGVVLEITDADEKPVDKLQLWIDETNSCEYMFDYYDGGSEVMAEMLQGLDTSNVASMIHMFAYCSNLTSLDLSNFNTSSVTEMRYMFYNCSGLTSLDLSSFNTSNVTSMQGMFQSCTSLTSLNLSNFNTSSVTNMGYMFNLCRNLPTIQGTLDLYSATNVVGMFSSTNGLTGVTLKNIRISLQIGSGTSWGDLWELSYLVNAVKELWDLSSGTQQTLTIGTANLEKIANVYVKLVDVTDEMIAQDPYSANKLPCVECESTDDGAMTLTAYAGLKNWVLA